jgi:hypothetical protein
LRILTGHFVNSKDRRIRTMSSIISISPFGSVMTLSLGMMEPQVYPGENQCGAPCTSLDLYYFSVLSIIVFNENKRGFFLLHFYETKRKYVEV